MNELHDLVIRLDRQEASVGSLMAMPTRPRQEYYSLRDAAAIVGVSTSRIRQALREGDLSFSDIGGEGRATYRISREDIRQWLEAKRSSAARTVGSSA
jgi:excisionase family DNA binding protein